MTDAATPPDPIDIFERSSRRAHTVMAAIRPEQLDAPTPCAEWNVRQVMNHIIGGAEVLAGNLLGSPPDGDIGGVSPNSSYSGEPDVSRLATAYAREAERAVAAARQPGATERPTPGGMMTAAQFLIAMATDHIIHAWDLARATGQDDTLDAEVVRASHAMMTSPEGAGFVAMGRQAGFIGPEVAVPDGASLQDKLVAHMGRQP